VTESGEEVLVKTVWDDYEGQRKAVAGFWARFAETFTWNF